MRVTSGEWSVASEVRWIAPSRDLAMMQIMPWTRASIVSTSQRGVVRSYRDLLVWQRAMDLVVSSYRLAKRLPHDELYGLTSQIRRAAASVPANIAEGQGRRSTGQFLQFLGVANGSLLELETHLLVAERLGLLQSKDLESTFQLSRDVGRMLAGLTRRLRERQSRRPHWPQTTDH
jgi:four helix bundle protein